ncbi:Major Facilitator Superfamily protein [compost metagenome]
MFLNAISITVFILPLKYVAKESVGTATGIINGGGQVGSILSPAIMGYIISATNQNYDAAFWFLVVSSLVALAAGLTIHTRNAQI